MLWAVILFGALGSSVLALGPSEPALRGYWHSAYVPPLPPQGTWQGCSGR